MLMFINTYKLVKMNTVLDRIVTITRTKRALAHALGLTPMAINRWNPDKIPIKYVNDIEQLTAGQITREEIRPDIFIGE